MIQVDLEPHEQQILVQLMEVALSDLRMEISHTDSKDYRKMLKVRKRVIHKMLDGLGDPGHRTPAQRRVS